MTKLSQYLEPYLDGNDRRLSEGGLPITIGTFLSQTLAGRAKSYGGKYGQALKRSCIAVGAVEVPTKGGGRGYIRIQRQVALVEELAKEFFNCRDARVDLGTTGAALWISDPQSGHYIDAKDTARFFNWASEILRVRRSVCIHPMVLELLVLSWKRPR